MNFLRFEYFLVLSKNLGTVSSPAIVIRWLFIYSEEEL